MCIKYALVVALLLVIGITEGAPNTGDGRDSSSGGHYRPNPNHDSGASEGHSETGGYSASSNNADGESAGGSGYFPGVDDEGNGSAHIQQTGVTILVAVIAAKIM